MSDGTEFEVDMSGNLGVVAKRFAAELALMNARLKETEKALSRTESASKALSKSQSRLWNYKEHSVALERLRRGHLAGAPAMARFGRELRGFGVHGATLRKFTVDAAKTEAALRRLYRISGGGLRGAATVTRALASRAWNGGLREKAGSALWAGAKGAAGLAVGGAALAGGGAALGGGILGWNMAQTAIEAERVRFALDRITEGQGDKWWAQSADYARRFGLNINGVAENLMQMKASGFSDEMTKTLFLRMGDLRSLGATEETIGRALLAIRQVQAAGRLQGDELNQLSEAGINANFVYDALSKKLGKSRTEIIKLKEAGKLTSEVVIPAIADAIGMKTGGKAAGEAGEAAASGTVIGLWGKLKGAWSIASTRALGDESLAPLKESLIDFTGWLEGPGGNKTIGAFGGFVSRVFAAAPAIIDKVIWLLDKGLPAAWQGFTAGLESSGAGTAMDNILTGFRGLAGDDGAGASAALQQISKDAGSLVGSLATLAGWLARVIGYFDTLGGYTSKLDTLAKYGIGPTAPVKALSNAWSSVSGLFSGGGGALSADVPLSEMAFRGSADRSSWSVSSPSTDAVRQMGVGIPRLDSVASPRVSRAANISNDWHPTINQTVNVAASDTAGMGPGELGDVVGDRSERRLTESLRQLAYSNG